jgi:uncharacterized protein (TIGR02678 family)
VTSVSQVETSDKILFERRRAIRGLLRNPLLRASGDSAEEYALVLRHFRWLKHWFVSFPAWELNINREKARLYKLPADFLDDTRPAIDRTSGAAFTRRRYACLCLLLAALEQCEQDARLSELARSVSSFAAEDPDLQSAGFTFDIRQYDHRRDIVAGVRFLLNSGVLCRLDGDERQFLIRYESADVFYEINRRILASLLQASRSVSAWLAGHEKSAPASLHERAMILAGDPIPAGGDDRKRWLRSRLVRILLEEAVLYYDALNAEERQYLETHRGFLLRELCDATGMIAEVRAEGIALLDETGELTDIAFTRDGSGGHLNLLLVQWLSGFLRDRPGAVLPIAAVERYIQELIGRHDLGWHTADQPGAETRLTHEALSQLRSLRLIHLSADGVVPLAACARYAVMREE